MGSQTTGLKALVTGGGGFLGSRIARMLRERGDEVTVLGRNAYPHLERIGIKTVRADLTDKTAVRQSCEGVDIVFHVGAHTAIWGRRSRFFKINVEGTRHVIDACRHHGIPRMIYTSTPSVVFGHQDLCGVDESQPYPGRFLSHYAESKALAEQMVLAASGPELTTVALRPHLICGPGDPHLIPRVIERARRGRLIQVGAGENLVDITYIDNAAEAHLKVAEALEPTAACSGKAYFISQGEPITLWPWLNQLLEAVGAPTVTRSMTYQTAYRIGAILECLFRLTGKGGEPRMTRFLAMQLAKSHYFNINAARRDFGYIPRISNEECVHRLVAWLSTGKKDLGNKTSDAVSERVAVS